MYTNDKTNVWFTANKDGKTLYAIIPQDDETGTPTSVTWTGNIPAKGTKMINIATRKAVKYRTAGNITTVTIPSDSYKSNGVALKYKKLAL